MGRASVTESRRATAKERGSRAEELAVDYLTSQGYRMLARNHRCPAGEVDLIAWDGAVLCFIEVRSRSPSTPVDPLETITPQKIGRIVRAAWNFLESWQGPWPEMRFDAVGILMTDPPRIELVREAFEA